MRYMSLFDGPDLKDAKEPCLINIEKAQSASGAALIDAMREVNTAILRVHTMWNTAVCEKRDLHETSYVGRLEAVRNNPRAFNEAKNKQNQRRVRYEGARIGMRLLHSQLQKTRAKLRDAIGAAIPDARSADPKIRFALQNNILRARDLVAAADEMMRKEFEESGVRGDVTNGRGLAAVQTVFDDLTVPAADRTFLLWNDEIMFIESVADYVNGGADPDLLMLFSDFEKKFAAAWEKLHEAKFALFHLEQNRGTLNEGQYAEALEKPSADVDKLFTAQQKKREAHASCAVFLECTMAEAAAAVDELVPYYDAVLDIVRSHRQRVMACYGGEQVVHAVMVNCIAAEAVIRDSRERKFKEFAASLEHELTRQSLRARDEMFQEQCKK